MSVVDCFIFSTLCCYCCSSLSNCCVSSPNSCSSIPNCLSNTCYPFIVIDSPLLSLQQQSIQSRSSYPPPYTHRAVRFPNMGPAPGSGSVNLASLMVRPNNPQFAAGNPTLASRPTLPNQVWDLGNWMCLMIHIDTQMTAKSEAYICIYRQTAPIM